MLFSVCKKTRHVIITDIVGNSYTIYVVNFLIITLDKVIVSCIAPVELLIGEHVYY